MSQNIGCAANDLTANEEVRMHSPKQYVEGEIVELKSSNYIHECKILKRLPEESEN